LISERLTAQLLAGPPARDPETVVHRLLAVQGQDARGVRLAIRARTAGLTAGDVDRALTSDRSLLITWLNRCTLHLVRSEDYPWLHALTAPLHVTANARRLHQEGVSPDDGERGVDVISRALAADGPLSREQLGERLATAGVPTKGQALIQLLLLASIRGVVVRGPMVEHQHLYVLARDWLGEPAPFDRDRAVAELARRYLVGHGPADDRDLAKWAGLRLSDARAGLRAIATELDEWPDGLVDLTKRPRRAELPPPRLLGSFDPVLMGWRSRAGVLGDHQSVVTTNGIFRPIALVEGRAVGTWTMSGGRVLLAPFDSLASTDVAALAGDALDVACYLGVTSEPSMTVKEPPRSSR
jgi:hypothetical protein